MIKRMKNTYSRGSNIPAPKKKPPMLPVKPPKMTKDKKEITISRYYFQMVAEKVINNIGDHLNTEVYVPFIEDCAYVMAVLEAELFGKED